MIFPQEAPAEQEGTLTHPDGRVQRARPAIRRPDGVRAGWWVLAQLAARLGERTALHTASMVFAEMADDVPFLAPLTLDGIGGKGCAGRDRSGCLARREGVRAVTGAPTVVPPANGTLRLARASSLWRGAEVAAAPALRFLVPASDARLAPADAERLGLHEGAPIALTVDGTTVDAIARLDSRVPAGTVVAQAGVPGGGADELPAGPVEVRSA